MANRRNFILFCSNCGLYFSSASNKTKLCQKCSSYYNWLNSHICSYCNNFSENRDQNGRGYDCGCHDNFFKEKTGNGNCLNCGIFNRKRSMIGYGLTDCNCGIKVLNEISKNNTLEGECTICRKHNLKRTIAGLGYDCGCAQKQIKETHKINSGPGYCVKCNIFNNKRNLYGIGIDVCSCISKISSKNLEKARKEHMILLENNYEYRAKILKNLIGGEFYRDKFYKEKFDIIRFESLNIIATLEDFDQYKGKCGVWARWTSDDICLDVCKSKDVGSEMLSSLRSFYSLKENPNQELDVGWKKKYKKQLEDCGKKPIIFKVIQICANELEALKIEAQYAHDNKAKYWSPEPGQNKIMEEK